MPEIATKEDLQRVEEKLDAIIRHFNIGRKPRRSAKELEEMAQKKVLKLVEKRAKRRHGSETNK